MKQRVHVHRSRLTAGTLAAAMALGGLGVAASAPASATTARSAASVVAKITGPDAMNDTVGRWEVNGTDLGILWDDGHGGVLAAFGDTFGPASTDWRSNVLLRSSDHDLTDGMTFDTAVTGADGRAREILPGVHDEAAGEVTKIPTAGISVGHRQYVSYMSVGHWGDPGMWDTNYASIAYSDDDGETWVTTGTPTWDNPSLTDPFQMQALVRSDGYLYVFGTPSGRNGSAYLARVPESSVLTKADYRYWDGTAWVASESSATPVVDAPVSELSVQYDAYSRSWLMMYLQAEDIVLRSAPTPEGPWGPATVVASSADYPQLYGGFMHPWNADGTIYFTMSLFGQYDVYLMKVQIDRDAQVVDPNLVTDPSFERGASTTTGDPGSWACTGSCGVDAGVSWSFTGTGNGWVRYNQGWHDLHQTVPVAPNTDYRLTGWVRTSLNSDNGFFGVRDTAGAVVSEANFVTVPTWTRFTVDFNSGPRTEVVVYGGVWTDHGDIWVQLDDLSVVAKPHVQPVVWSVTVSPGTATVPLGGSRQFTAATDGDPASDTAGVTYSVVGASSAGTAIDSAGLLTVAPDETATSLTVTAASVVDPSRSASALVTLVPALWRPTVVYDTGDRVTYGGATFEAGWWTSGEVPGSSAYGAWQQVATGADGTAVWTASRVFLPGDVATYQGVAYRAAWWTRNQPPGDPYGPWRAIA